ncbi:hypothetical protein JCM10213_005128 [Rhodosporidiobolus nylandii]
MPSTLPDELLHHILLLAALPPAHETSQHRARLRTLSACCLTSKRFLGVARPLLWEVVVVRWKRDVKAVEASDAELTGRTRRFVAQMTAFGMGCSVVDALEMLSTLNGVEDVSFLQAPKAVPLRPLAALQNLRHLTLRECRLNIPHYAALPTLESLTLSTVAIDRGDLASLLSSHTTPSLRALAVSRLRTPRLQGVSDVLFPSLTANLAVRLEMLQVHWQDERLFPPRLFKTDDFLVLYAFSPLHASFTSIYNAVAGDLPPHFMICGVPDLSTAAFARLPLSDHARMLDNLEELNYYLEEDSCIQSVFLPHSLAPGADIHPSLSHERDELTRIVSTEHYGFRHEVRWRSGTSGKDDGSALCVEAWEFAKRLKREGKGSGRFKLENEE